MVEAETRTKDIDYTMTAEAQRIAIATACGWTVSEGAHGVFYFPPGVKPGSGFAGYRSLEHVPDYLNDLNAMHEAEKILNNGQWALYDKWLLSVATPHQFVRYRHVIHSTTTQRAEAFLRTIGKWEDVK